MARDIYIVYYFISIIKPQSNYCNWLYSSLLPSEHLSSLTALWIMQTKVHVDPEQDFSIWTKKSSGSNKGEYNLSIFEIRSYLFMSLRNSFRSHWKYLKSFFSFPLFCIQDCMISVLLTFLCTYIHSLFTFILYLLILVWLSPKDGKVHKVNSWSLFSQQYELNLLCWTCCLRTRE